MDASDVMRKLRTQTIYNYLVSDFAKNKPNANITSAAIASSNTVINYKDYDQRLDVAIGKYYLVHTSTVTFITNGT